MNELDGKCVVITGSGRGLGAAYARCAAAVGAAVVVNDIEPEPVDGGRRGDPGRRWRGRWSRRRHLVVGRRRGSHRRVHRHVRSARRTREQRRPLLDEPPGGDGSSRRREVGGHERSGQCVLRQPRSPTHGATRRRLDRQRDVRCPGGHPDDGCLRRDEGGSGLVHVLLGSRTGWHRRALQRHLTPCSHTDGRHDAALPGSAPPADVCRRRRRTRRRTHRWQCSCSRIAAPRSTGRSSASKAGSSRS